MTNTDDDVAHIRTIAATVRTIESSLRRIADSLERLAFVVSCLMIPLFSIVVHLWLFYKLRAGR